MLLSTCLNIQECLVWFARTIQPCPKINCMDITVAENSFRFFFESNRMLSDYSGLELF